MTIKLIISIEYIVNFFVGKMCKCCQHCLESCYWNLIEEKFCFDESIALYEEPVKKSSEKNNNMFDNMAFFDSVSVIAGRAIVTIDPLELHRNKKPPTPPVLEQPRKRLTNWPEKNSKDLQPEFLRKGNAPLFKHVSSSDQETTDTDGTESEAPQEKLLHKKALNKLLNEKFLMKKSVSFHNIPEKSSSSSDESDYKIKTRSLMVPEEEEVTLRAKSLRERRMSKSLSLKIGDISHKELPIIRQNSMPKFYLDTPDENQIRDSTLMRQAASVLKSPMVASGEFNFDLYSVVQIEKDRQIIEAKNPPAPIHRETSKLNLFKDKIMLKKSKSTVSASNLPYSNHI